MQNTNQSLRFQFMKLTSLALLFLALVSPGVLAQGGAPKTAPISSEYAEALRNGDVRQLRALLDQGASPNARDAAGNTPLMQAAVYGDIRCVRLLLERGAQVNAWNSHRTVELLLARGADTKATNLFGADALMAAAAGGDAGSVQLLLQHGADPNGQPGIGTPQFVFGGGRSALMWAAFRGDLAIIKLLLDTGANPNAEGMTGTPLEQAAWADRTDAARLLIERGAQPNQADHMAGYTPLHWAASTENGDPALVKLLLDHGANPDAEGGQNMDAFMDVPQTPLMLARKRGETPVLAALLRAGANKETPDKIRATPNRQLAGRIDDQALRSAIGQAIPLLQHSSIESKKSFVKHASRQDCVSCHQQYLPLAAVGVARRSQVAVDRDSEAELVKMVQGGELKNSEADWQALFHPDSVQTKGHAMLSYALAELPADEHSDAVIHHLAAIQSKDGRWFNNLPRPPIQGGDIGATALAINALQRYPLPGLKAELAKQVDKGRQWLWTVKPQNTDHRIYQLLGLAWAGESTQKLQPLARALIAEQ
jgi:ankyrin repeat protein